MHFNSCTQILIALFMRHIYFLFCALFIVSFTGRAQIVTTDPAIIQENSSPIVITFHADKGNKGLAGLTASTPIYAHTGVILKGQDSWSHAPEWLDNSAKYKLTYKSADTWELTLPGIKEYYGITSGETVERLAFVFRNATGTKEGKTESGGDIFVNVYPADEFVLVMTPSVTPGLLSGPAQVNFTVNTTENADISLTVNGSEKKTAADAKTLSYTMNITGTGTTKVTARATCRGMTKEETVTYVWPNSPVEKPYPGGVPKMGATRAGNGDVTFCIAAPGKTRASLCGEWNGYAPSADTYYCDYEGNRYFWWTVSGLKANTDYIYYYNIDGTNVGDPYARLVLDPWNDKYIPASVFPDMPEYPSAYVGNTCVAVYNSSIDEYDWKVTNFKGVPQDRLVIYELLIRDFTGTEGKAEGNGTIAGVMEKLDYLQSLGVNAIELLPVMEFSGNNSWGYNPNFYFAPDKAYGTPDDYRRLIDAIHERGMAVILDVVFNQTDGQHPWWLMYTPAKNPFYNASAPHGYSVLNDWKQENPLVQQQFKDVLKYWLEAYNVDGFRFDLVKGLGNDDSYNATYNPSTNKYSGVTDAKTNAYNASRVARMKELHSAMKEVKPDAYFINENLATAKEENEMALDGEINWANINEAACQFAMGYSSNCNLNRFYAPDDSRTAGSTVSYAESHDEERMAYKVAQYGVEEVKDNTEMTMRRLGSVAAIMLMTPGAHMIWQFQEFGADETTKTSTGGNETKPKKVVWKYLDNEYRAGLKETYALLNDIRNGNPQLFGKDAKATMKCNSGNWTTGFSVTVKSADGTSELYCIVNPSTTIAQSVAAPFTGNASDYTMLCGSYGTTPELNGKEVRLAPGAFVVYASKDVTALDDILNDNAATARVHGGAGTITIDGVYETVKVFTIDGVAINRLDSLASGIYIVVVDGVSHKVSVR